jgi:hypothetical protein
MVMIAPATLALGDVCPEMIPSLKTTPDLATVAGSVEEIRTIDF